MGDNSALTIFMTLITGGVGAAIVGIADKVIMFKLNRGATKEDKKDDEEKKWKESIDRRFEGINNKLDALTDAQVSIMLNDIKNQGMSYIKEKEVDYDDRMRLHKMHECYHRLGGNGDLDLIMKQVNDLPLKNE